MILCNLSIWKHVVLSVTSEEAKVKFGEGEEKAKNKRRKGEEAAAYLSEVKAIKTQSSPRKNY